MTVVLHRLNPGNYVTDLAEDTGTWCVCRYRGDDDIADGWLVLRKEIVWGTHAQAEYVMREWVPTLVAARAYIAHMTTDLEVSA